MHIPQHSFHSEHDYISLLLQQYPLNIVRRTNAFSITTSNVCLRERTTHSAQRGTTIGGFAGQPPHTGYEANPHDFEHRGFDTKMVTRYSLQTHIKMVLDQKFNHTCLLRRHRCKVTAWTLSPSQITGATPSGSIPRLMVILRSVGQPGSKHAPSATRSTKRI